MVTIVDYKTFTREDEENFYGLIVQGGIEAVKSQQTGKMYFTARTVVVPTTFNEKTCCDLVGSKIPGVIKKVETDPYDYTITETGEVIELHHRYEFVSEEDHIVDNNVVKKELVY
jgi:hypothetical protein